MTLFRGCFIVLVSGALSGCATMAVEHPLEMDRAGIATEPGADGPHEVIVVSQSPAAAEPGSLDALISRLGSADFSAREAAGREIAGRGTEIQTALVQRLERETDPEIRLRLKEIVARNSEMISVVPPGISVHWKSATAGEVGAALMRETGMPLNGWTYNGRATFTLDVENRPFWEVMAEVARQAEAVSGSGGGGQMNVREGRHMLPMVSTFQRHDAFVALVEQELAVCDRADSPARLRVMVAADPRVVVNHSVGGVQIFSVIDEAGRVYPQPPRVDDPFADAQDKLMWLETAEVMLPGARGHTVHIAGQCKLFIQTFGEQWALEDLEGKVGETRLLGTHTFTVHEFAYRQGIVHMLATLRTTGAGGFPLVASLYDGSGANTWRSHPSLEGDGAKADFGMSAGAGPWRMVFRRPGVLKEVVVPFEMDVRVR